MNFQEIIAEATKAQKEITVLEEKLVEHKEIRNNALKKIIDPVTLCCNEAFGIYKEQGGGIRIVLDDKVSFDLENKAVNLRVRMYKKGGDEFNEWLDSNAELNSYTHRLRDIISPIFNTAGIPLVLGRLSVDPSYFTK